VYTNELMTIHSVALLLFRFKNSTRRPYCIPGNGIRIHQDEVASGMVMFIRRFMELKTALICNVGRNLCIVEFCLL